MSLVAEQAPIREFISEQDLFRRPPEQGIAVDPDNPSEIDDAIWAEPLRTKKGFSRIQVHIADAGLLYGHDDIISQARRNGWSEYFEDDRPPLLMMDEAVAVNGLSLNIGHHDTPYAPAVTVAFTFDQINRRILNPSISKTRVVTQSLSYSQFEKRVKAGRGGKPTREQHEDRYIYLRARELAKPPGKFATFRGGRVGNHTVRNYMVVANSIIAKDREEQGAPWLFRNHHMANFEHPQSQLIAHLYPNTAEFIKQQRAWYSRIPTIHANLGTKYCHFTSPLRRFPDLANHLNLHADLEGLPRPYDAEAMDEIAREMGQKIIAAINVDQIIQST